MQISKEQYLNYVDFLKQNDPIERPVFMYESYENPQCKAHLARSLVIYFRESQPEFMLDAFHILEDAVNEMLTDEDDDGNIAKDQIVWAYNDLAVWGWNLLSDVELSLQFANKGLEFLTYVSDTELFFGVRGQLWYNRWMMLNESGKTEEAVSECQDQIHIAIGQKKIYSSNSMLYYGYMFMAEVSKANCDWEKGITSIQEAAKYIDLFEEHREYDQKEYFDVLKDKNEDLKNTFEKLHKIVDRVSHIHQAWDYTDTSSEERV